MELYRCGWCGQPTSKDGEVMSMSQIGLIKDLKLWDAAEPVPGDCCRHEHEGHQMVEVTREMAIDAGCQEMEGQMIEW